MPRTPKRPHQGRTAPAKGKQDSNGPRNAPRNAAARADSPSNRPKRKVKPGRRHSDEAQARTNRPQRAGKRTTTRDAAPSPTSPRTAAGRPAHGPRPKRPGRPPSGRPTETMRIAKAMARAGLCSRRDAERWITDGRVKVNGETITSPALDVTPKDRILVDGAPLPDAEPTMLWRYAKPKGLVTTHRDPEGRPTVFESLPDDMPRVVSIGRLDFNTEGLLLLTTDGELARFLELPATGWLRRYRVRAHVQPGKSITQADLDKLKDGISVEGVHYGPIEATLDSRQGLNVWLTIGLREGKNREVRKILASLELDVNRLIRVSFGPFQLLDLKPGTVEQVRRKTLIDQLGPRLAEQFKLTADDEPVAAPTQRKPARPRPPANKRSTSERKPPRRK